MYYVFLLVLVLFLVMVSGLLQDDPLFNYSCDATAESVCISGAWVSKASCSGFGKNRRRVSVNDGEVEASCRALPPDDLNCLLTILPSSCHPDTKYLNPESEPHIWSPGGLDSWGGRIGGKPKGQLGKLSF